MDLNLEGKIVFITGGSKGIGKAISLGFYQEGAQVAVSSRSKEALTNLEAELEGVRSYQADLLYANERERVFHQLIQEFGRIDILVNNLGGSNGAGTMETSLSLFESALQLNYLSAVHFSQMAAAEMKKSGGGAIINISSIYGRESGGRITYNNSKAALISFTKGFANEVIKDGIRVNGVAPGSILHPTGNWQKRLNEDPEKILQFVSDEIPAGRFGTAEEIAQVVLFLASEKASWVVGATLNVDGGQSHSNF